MDNARCGVRLAIRSSSAFILGNRLEQAAGNPANGSMLLVRILDNTMAPNIIVSVVALQQSRDPVGQSFVGDRHRDSLT